MKKLLLLLFCLANLQAAIVNGASILDNKKESGMLNTGTKATVRLLYTGPGIVIQHSTQFDKFIRNKIVSDTGVLVKGSPEELVQRQLNAYNSRDIEAFLEPYAEGC